MAAFGDTDQLICYAAYTCIWPTAGWSISTIAAVLNSHVANAFVATHEGDRNNTIEIVREIPIPLLSRKTIAFIDSRVEAYQRAVDSGGLFAGSGESSNGDPASILGEIDAAILKAYNLPASLESSLVNYFRVGITKRPVPFAKHLKGHDTIDNSYAIIESLLEPPGSSTSESWETLQESLDSDRLSARKLFP